MNYGNDDAIKRFFGIETWRNLSQDKVMRAFAAIPEMDRELALQVIRQVPELTTFAKALLEDAAQAHAALLAANASNMAAVHEFDRAILETLSAELEKDLSAEERMRVFDEIRDLHTRVHAKDTQDKEFLAAHSDKRLAERILVGAALLVVLAGAAKSGGKTGGALRALRVA